MGITLRQDGFHWWWLFVVVGVSVDVDTLDGGIVWLLGVGWTTMTSVMRGARHVSAINAPMALSLLEPWPWAKRVKLPAITNRLSGCCLDLQQ